MKAITYETDPNVTPPGWATNSDIHRQQSRGIAYEEATHFVHFYSAGGPLWTLSPGLTVTEEKSNRLLRDWAVLRFGASNIQPMQLNAGEVYDGLWRPGLGPDEATISSSLNFSFSERRSSELVLLLILERLNDLLLYVEPEPQTLGTYGHKQRELLLLAATEVEAHWKWFLARCGVKPRQRGFSTQDYVRLNTGLFLSDYDVLIPRYPLLAPLSPFLGWSKAKPTQSLPWYAAYNEVKHDRVTKLTSASLEMYLLAVAANIVLFVSRFGPLSLYEGRGNLSAQFNETFSVDLARADPTTFYVPRVQIASQQVPQFVTYNALRQQLANKSIPIVL